MTTDIWRRPAPASLQWHNRQLIGIGNCISHMYRHAPPQPHSATLGTCLLPGTTPLGKFIRSVWDRLARVRCVVPVRVSSGELWRDTNLDLTAVGRSSDNIHAGGYCQGRRWHRGHHRHSQASVVPSRAYVLSRLLQNPVKSCALTSDRISSSCYSRDNQDIRLCVTILVKTEWPLHSRSCARLRSSTSTC